MRLSGLPLEWEKCEGWRGQGPPRFAMLLPALLMVGDSSAIENAVKSGKLAAFVLRKSGAPDDDSPPRHNFKTEFDRRFVLITPDNIEQVKRSYPGLF